MLRNRIQDMLYSFGTALRSMTMIMGNWQVVFVIDYRGRGNWIWRLITAPGLRGLTTTIWVNGVINIQRELLMLWSSAMNGSNKHDASIIGMSWWTMNHGKRLIRQKSYICKNMPESARRSLRFRYIRQSIGGGSLTIENFKAGQHSTTTILYILVKIRRHWTSWYGREVPGDFEI